MSGNLLQRTKLCVNLKSAILRCSAVLPNAVISESSAVFNLAVVGELESSSCCQCVGMLSI